ncbi:MAG: GIY-YIG nuclease family protein [Chitinophagaceae bacterium]
MLWGQQPHESGALLFMAYYVYILQSEKGYSYYKGFSENPLQRLDQHSNKESFYTAAKAPWKIVYLEILQTKREALIREKALKKYSRSQIQL